MPSRTWVHGLDVIGLGFRMKKQNREELARILKNADITGVRLTREPDNQYDPNAIAVYLPERTMGGAQLGYLRRSTAELLAPKIDNGTLVVVRAKLLDLRAGDDFKEGGMEVVFRDVPAKKPTTKAK